MRAQPCPVDHFLDSDIRLPRARPRADSGPGSRESAHGARAGGGYRRSVGHRETSRIRRPNDERAISPGLLGAGVRSGVVPVPAARLLRDAPLSALTHERGRGAPGPGELPTRAERGANPGGRAALARLRAHSRANVRHRGWWRRSCHLHDCRSRDRTGPALQAAVRLALYRGRARWAPPAASGYRATTAPEWP